jgi:hypothetical protein
LKRIAAFSAVVVLLSPFLAQGDEAASSSAPPLTDIRKEMLSEYKFAPSGTKAAPLPTSLHSDAPAQLSGAAPTGRDVVRMAPFEVRETSAAAFMPFAPAISAGTRATAASKLGIGVHHMLLGKVHVFVSTLFYVPILVGFEW